MINLKIDKLFEELGKELKETKENSLKSKLEELGYVINEFIEEDDLDSDCTFTGEKDMGRGIYIVIGLLDDNKLMGYVYDQFHIHKNKERLKVLELAIETMEKDLEVLKKYED